MKIQHTVSVSFKIRYYEDTIECDVVPMMVCHMLLVRPWQYDKGAIHDGRSNTYSFKWQDKSYVLCPMTPSQIIADNAKTLARAQHPTQHALSCEMRGERENHHIVSEYQKPKSVLFATKRELREVQHNTTNLHYVLICKGEVLETNTSQQIPPKETSKMEESVRKR